MDTTDAKRSTAGRILDAIPFPVLLIGEDDRILSVNPAVHGLFGSGIEGKTAALALRHPAFLDALDETRRRGQARLTTIQLSARGGGEVKLRVHLSPVTTADGDGVIVSFEDLTAIETAEAMRRDFIANVSHELRTPLTALTGFIETLRGAARDDPQARERFLSIMEREAGRMIRLVSDLLSLSRVEAEERQRPDDMVDLSALLRSVVQTLRARAEGNGVVLKLDGAEMPVTIPGDHDQLVQVFTNLVENAVKYAASGKEVRLVMEAVEREPFLRGPAVRVDVVDRGEGIDPIHLPRLTERFYRVDAHRSREQGGTGLGLAIVKHIVSRHRGRLKIESVPGKGSKFSVILPVS